MQFSLHPTSDDGSFRAEWYQYLSSLWQQPQPSQREGKKVPAELEMRKGQLEDIVLQNNGAPDRTGEQHTPLPALADTARCYSGRGLSYIRVKPFQICRVFTSE